MKMRMSLISRTYRENGYLLVFVMAISLALMTVVVAVVGVSTTKYAKTSRDGDAASAVYAAEAGVSDTLVRLNQNESFTGYSTKKEFYSTTAKGKAEYTTSVVNNGNNTVTVTSTGYYSDAPTSSTPSATRTVKSLLIRTKLPVTENVLAGSAGITMSGTYFPWFGQPTAMQKGMVYSRGKIRLNGAATSIGSSTDSARVAAANIGCGNTTNFPQQCASNDPPIVLGGGYFGGGIGSIYGSVCATDQTSTTNIFPGPTGTGLQTGCIAPDYGTPYFDKKSFTDVQVLPILPAAATCAPLVTTAAWADHSRMIGNVTVAKGFLASSCNVTLLGDVYIKGDLTIDDGASITVSNLLGTRKPVIVVNGKVTIKGSSNGVIANSSGSHATIISFYSTNTSCSNSDDNNCTLTSAQLYNSSVQGSGSFWYNPGVNRAITIGGGSSAQNANLSGLAAYSYYGSTLYQKDGNASMRGIGGQEVVINPGGAFSWMGGTLSVTDTAPFTGVLNRYKYVIGDYQQVF